MDLVFLGSGAFGLPTLRALAGAHRIRAVVTQPDRPAGRGGAMTPTPVAQWAAANLSGVPVFKPERVNDTLVVREVRGAAAEAWVVIAFGQKLGRALLEGVFAVNLHASLLPRWRGAAPINAAILAGDERTGNSVITLAERMDAGAVLGRSERAIDPMQTAGELHDALAADGPDVVMRVLTDCAAGRVRCEEQDESRVTLAPKLSRADGWVDFRDSAEAARRRVHGLTPWPGVTVLFRGQPLKLLRVRPERGDREGAPGSLMEPEAGTVACGAGTTLALLEVQPAGKRAMPWSEYARGQRPAAGEMFIGRSGGVA
jgi:methionyl-tRNA formyltransferase